jgi:hypothetical protein
MRAAVLFGLLSASLTLAPSTASASPIHVVTFTGNSEYSGTNVWVEDGVTATGEIHSFGTPGTVHLDPGGTPYGGSISFTTGSLFDALSIDISSPGGLYCATTNPSECDGEPPDFVSLYDDPYPNVWIAGFVDDRLVSTLGIARPTFGFETLLLGTAFARIDRLTVEVLHPIYDLGLTGACSVEYCGHFSLDNVVLRDAAPIPEPSAAIVFGFGLALLRRSAPFRLVPD